MLLKDGKKNDLINLKNYTKKKERMNEQRRKQKYGS